MSVRPPACMEQLDYCWTDFQKILFGAFTKIYWENSYVVKIRQK